GCDEGEADQGVEAEGTPVGVGGHREDIGGRCNGGRNTGAGIKERKRLSESAQQRGAGQERGRTRKNTQSDSSMAVVGERARRGEPGREIPSVRWTPWLPGGSLQPPIPGSGTPSPRNRGSLS